MEKPEFSLLVGMQSDTETLENSLAVSYKAKHTLTFDPEIPLLSIYPREMQTTVLHTRTCTQTFVAALLKIASNWRSQMPLN